MRALDADRLHERGHVVGEQLHRIGAVRLVGLTRSARVERDAGEVLGIVRDLKGVAGVVGGKIGNENERLACSLSLVIDRDAVRVHFRHVSLPGGFVIGPRGCTAECPCYQR